MRDSQKHTVTGSGPDRADMQTLLADSFLPFLSLSKLLTPERVEVSMVPRNWGHSFPEGYGILLC